MANGERSRSQQRTPGRVLFVGFEDQGNLGLGYMTAVLRDHGYDVQFADLRRGAGEIARAARDFEPILIGFSLIFQYYLPDYRDLARSLRRHGVGAHFIMGGHYPTLEPDHTLEFVPELDSIGLYEGEFTVLELCEALRAGEDWRRVPGLAYRCGSELRRSGSRRLIEDLDELPHPVRISAPLAILGRRAVPLLASRGCARRCSFCSIHSFYRGAEGRVVRLRRPDRVVDEMVQLHEQLGASIFLFQDDDFPVWGRRGKQWAEELCAALHRSGLAERVIWKISCRVDDIEPALFSRLRDAGLYFVYLGLESGTDEGLRVLNKGITPEQNLAAVNLVKLLNLTFAYGFMLFEPASTFDSVRRNVGFLRAIVGDGSAALTFCKMLPYGGTPIRDQLAAEGRLRGDVVAPDYTFIDPRLNGYHPKLDAALSWWSGTQGLGAQLHHALHETDVLERLFPAVAGTLEYRQGVRSLIARANTVVLDAIDESSSEWERSARLGFDAEALAAQGRDFGRQMLEGRNRFVASHERELVRALDNDTTGQRERAGAVTSG